MVAQIILSDSCESQLYSSWSITLPFVNQYLAVDMTLYVELLWECRIRMVKVIRYFEWHTEILTSEDGSV